MGPLCLLLTAALLLAQAAPLGASQHCGRLEYLNPDYRCCGSCLQRFGPPPCPDFEFSETAGSMTLAITCRAPSKSVLLGSATPTVRSNVAPVAAEPRPLPPRGAGAAKHSGAAERSVPPKEPCPLNTGKPSVLSSQEPSPSAISSVRWTSEHNVTQQALLNFALPVVLVLLVLVLLVTSAVILLLAQRCHRQAKGLHPYPGLVCGDTNTHTLFSLHSSSPGSLEASEAGVSRKVALVPLLGRERPHLASQPLSRLLDELEVLEELTVLLDPEPGPGGGVACGTTRHLAARYGVPAAWSTFAYSLRPSRSPLRALIEMVAREPSASLGQLGTHLAQLGRADALQVLSKLG